MSKSKRSKRSRGVVDRSATTDVVTQLECAFRNPHAALIGAVIGGLVPWFGRALAHDQVPAAWSASNTSLAITMIAVVLGCASSTWWSCSAAGALRATPGFTVRWWPPDRCPWWR